MFIVDAELDHEFAIHIFRRSVLTRHTAACDDDWPDQTGVDVFTLIYMRVIRPEGSTPFVFGGAGATESSAFSLPLVLS